jgi:hypothetical protein
MTAMRAALILSCLLMAAPPAFGQEKGGSAQPGSAVKPPATNCTDVQVGSAQSYDCINAQLGTVAHATPRFSSDTDAPVTSSSPSNVVGTFNEGATRNRLGANFGHSAVPYRPAPANPPALPAPR